MKKYAIGIDIGGTKISMVVGNRQGKILLHQVIPTRIGQHTKACLQDLVEHLKKMLAQTRIPKNQIAGIGMGLPGPVDSKKGIVPRSPHLGGWEGIRLRDFISKKMNLPCFMMNDANAAALGEKLFGEGKKVQSFVYMTISTGIGGGVVINGQIVEGASYVGGEVGHMTVVPKGESCKCGKSGCLEAYASGTAIARYVEREIKQGTRSCVLELMHEDGKITAQMVGQAARKNDVLALKAYEYAGFYLGIGIANILNILNPEMVILGGGVLKSAPKIFLQSMMESCKRDAWPQAFEAVKIVQTKLGDQVGNLGALALAFSRP